MLHSFPGFTFVKIGFFFFNIAKLSTKFGQVGWPAYCFFAPLQDTFDTSVALSIIKNRDVFSLFCSYLLNYPPDCLHAFVQTALLQRCFQCSVLRFQHFLALSAVLLFYNSHLCCLQATLVLSFFHANLFVFISPHCQSRLN